MWKNGYNFHTLTHGQRNTRLYHIWTSMKQRCCNPNHKYYNLYGGRGISVCEEWLNFEPFYEWAKASGYNDKLTIDRKDNDKGYSPDNCRWTTQKVQCNNRRNNVLLTCNGKTQTLTQWSEELGIGIDTLWRRMNVYGWDVERTLTEKVTRGGYKRK